MERIYTSLGGKRLYRNEVNSEMVKACLHVVVE